MCYREQEQNNNTLRLKIFTGYYKKVLTLVYKMWILWHFFSFKNIILVYIALTFAQMIHCTKIKLCLETKRLFFPVYYVFHSRLVANR